MSRENKLKLPDEQFMGYANTINDQSTAHASEWNLDATRVSELNTLTANANQAYRINLDRATSNRTTSTNKKTAFRELKEFLSLYVDYLEGNLSVPDSALAIMDLRPRKHHAHQPDGRPEETPNVTVVKQHDEMTIYVSRAEHGQPTQSVKLPKYHGFKLRWRFEGETGYHIEVSTRLHFTIHFNREDETRRVILSAAWINNRLEEGPWSEDIIEIVG
ncbi:MAG: hypothetical protein LBP98_10125 [Tannerella sp.]|jgi:hypothetical protein|nr:hypothetical protein [Tannerella sp.]